MASQSQSADATSFLLGLSSGSGGGAVRHTPVPSASSEDNFDDEEERVEEVDSHGASKSVSAREERKRPRDETAPVRSETLAKYARLIVKTVTEVPVRTPPPTLLELLVSASTIFTSARSTRAFDPATSLHLQNRSGPITLAKGASAVIARPAHDTEAGLAHDAEPGTCVFFYGLKEEWTAGTVDYVTWELSKAVKNVSQAVAETIFVSTGNIGNLRWEPFLYAIAVSVFQNHGREDEELTDENVMSLYARLADTVADKKSQLKAMLVGCVPFLLCSTQLMQRIINPTHHTNRASDRAQTKIFGLVADFLWALPNTLHTLPRQFYAIFSGVTGDTEATASSNYAAFMARKGEKDDLVRAFVK